MKKEKIRLEQKHTLNPIKSKADWQKIAEDINIKGSEKHKWAWLHANERAVSAADELGIDYSHPLIRAFMMKIIFAALEKKSITAAPAAQTEAI